MSLTRGDVVVVEFPAGPGNPPKRRPAVVVQTDRNNVRLASAIFAMVTSNTRLADRESTQVLIDISTPEGKQSGLRQVSAVKCENLQTLPMASTHRIGRLTPQLMTAVDAALRAALDL
jgi:mRNA-degrading endonuclease toxin of MazEF toxin-antitoxin module